MKKSIYYSTFIPGLGSVIESLLNKKLKTFKIVDRFDGGILYETPVDPSRLKNLDFFNNSFSVIDSFKYAQSKNYETLIRKFLDKKININTKMMLNVKNFKILFSNMNQFVSVSRETVKEFESFIRKQYRMTYIPSSSKAPSNEFWVLSRSENICFFMIKISGNPVKSERGELRKELANILVYISKPTASDRFLDPFAGHGSIPLSRVTIPFKKMCVFDTDPNCIEFIQKRVNAMKIQRRGDIFVGKQDFFTASLKEQSFNRIVSDPPWGTFSKIKNIESFYQDMFDKFVFLLEQEGIIVLLVERKLEQTIQKIMEKYKNKLVCDNKYEILLSGKKATIYKFFKKYSL